MNERSGLISEHPPQPVRWPVMLQAWEFLTFIHWRYRPEVIRPLIPRGLELDTFDGSAWVGLVPFLLTGLRPPFAPGLPWLSKFPETNVRTYVRGPDGERGVWFFTLEAARLTTVISARLTFGLPYRWARMRVQRHGDQVHYSSRRHFGQAHTNIAVHIGRPIQANEQERFLTARFRLYTRVFGRVAFALAEHPPWPLHSATLASAEQSVMQHVGLPAPEGKPLVHYSPGISVRIGMPASISKG